MELSLLPILNFDGKKIDISDDFFLTSSENDGFEIKTPVSFSGFIQNINGTYELCGKAFATLSFVCDRCLKAFDMDLNFEINERFKKEDLFSEETDDADIITFSGTSIDFDEVLYTNLYLNLPSKNLCKDDCKGLCEVCGTNLNLNDCTCTKNTTDPRFDILDKLL